ncbi:MAG: galactokinase, partial [Bacteroidales bacterium]|nr:galactokinase [Bacteroidales bacterium]
KIKINHLSEINIDRIDIIDNLISDDTIKRRAHHVISENDRVVKAVNLLKNNDLIGFGRLMNESHDSLKNDYEVTGFELDTLVYEARALDGVIGSRMTGAGFGGCTVSLVHINKIDNFIEKLGDRYREKTGLTADFYQPSIGSGAGYLL